MNLRMFGDRGENLMIPAGAFRMPCTEKTREIKVLPDGNQRSDEHLYMNGPAVFSFTQTDVPLAIKDLFEFASIPLNAIDYFIFHQPNRFVLIKLAQKLGVPLEKMPNNIVEKFGSHSGPSIPVTICHNLSNILLKKSLQICMSGFGVGLSCGNLIMELGPLDFCHLIEK